MKMINTNNVIVLIDNTIDNHANIIIHTNDINEQLDIQPNPQDEQEPIFL
jgi:hypothetical protein